MTLSARPRRPKREKGRLSGRCCSGSSAAWPVPVAGAICRRISQADLLDMLPDWAARMYLRGPEMVRFRERPAFAWLLGRIAAKDAVREWLRREQGILLHPLEIEIANDASGAPVLTLPAAPGLTLSISHLEDEAIAGVAGGPIGVDLVLSEDRGPGFAPLALAPAELDALPGGRTRHLLDTTSSASTIMTSCDHGGPSSRRVRRHRAMAPRLSARRRASRDWPSGPATRTTGERPAARRRTHVTAGISMEF